MQGGLFWPALLLVLAVVGASGARTAPNLSGCWTNQLGSTADVELKADGSLRGTYKSKVSKTGEQVEGDLMGFQLNFNQPTFGFVVKWTTASVRGSVTVWTGQMFNIDSCHTLQTMWLLRRRSSAEKDWAATWTGQDVFRRCDAKCGSKPENITLEG